MNSGEKKRKTKDGEPSSKKPRRSCLARKKPEVNIQRDPTEPINLKPKKPRVSFAPKERVKEFSSYNSSSNSSASVTQEVTNLMNTFDCENKENQTNPDLSAMASSSGGATSPDLDSTLNLMHGGTLDFTTTESPGTSLVTKALFTTPVVDKQSVTITPKKRRSLLEHVTQKNLFTRQMSHEEPEETFNNSKFKANIAKLFGSSSPTTPERETESVGQDETLAYIPPRESPEVPSREMEKTVVCEQTMLLEKESCEKEFGEMENDQTLAWVDREEIPSAEKTVSVDKTMAIDETIMVDQTMNVHTKMDETVAVDQLVKPTINVARAMQFDSPTSFSSRMDSPDLDGSTMDFIALEKSLVSQSASRSTTPAVPCLTPINKLRRSLSGTREENGIPNFTPPSRNINLRQFGQELADENIIPGTPDASISKPRQRLMRARDSIGVAKFKMEQRITRDLTDEIANSPARSQPELTMELPTPKSTEPQVAQAEQVVHAVVETVHALADEVATPTNKTSQSLIAAVLTPNNAVVPRPRIQSHATFEKTKFSVEGTENLSGLSEFDGGDSFVSVDQTEACVLKKNLTEKVFSTEPIFDDSLANSLEQKTFNITFGFSSKQPVREELDLTQEEIQVQNEEVVKFLDDLADRAKNATNLDLESQGAVVDELIEDTASRLLFYHMKKPKLQYDEFIVKRLKKIMQKNSHLQMSAEDYTNLKADPERYQVADLVKLETMAKLVAERKFRSTSLQVLQKYRSTLGETDWVSETCAEIDNWQSVIEGKKRDLEWNGRKLEEEKTEVAEITDFIEAFAAEEQKIKSGESRLAAALEEIKLQEETLAQMSKDVADSASNDIYALSTESSVICIDDRIYFHKGLCYFDVTTDKFVVNENNTGRRLDADLYLLSQGHLKSVKRIFLSRLVGDLNARDDEFKVKVQTLKEGVERLITFARSVNAAMAGWAGFGGMCDEQICRLSCLVFLDSPNVVMLKWNVDLDTLDVNLLGVFDFYSRSAPGHMKETILETLHKGGQKLHSGEIFWPHKELKSLPFII